MSIAKHIILLCLILFCQVWSVASPLPSNLSQQSSFAIELNQLDTESLETLVEQEPNNLEARYQLGIRYHQIAQDDCEASLEKALYHFQYIYTTDSSRHEARAFYGSATVLKAKYVSIFSKLKYTRQGFAILDQTVQEHPNNFNVRLVRAANSIYCPGFLQRGHVAREDVEWLIQTIERQSQDIPQDAVKIARFYAGKFALNNEERRSLTLLKQSLNMACITNVDAKIEHTYQRAKRKFGKPTKVKPNHRPHQ